MKLKVQAIDHSIASKAKIKLYMARADLIHPLASGNKFYKLIHNLKIAKQQGHTQLLSFGGAFSNHIHALALTANKQGFSSIGVIRGEAQYASNPTLQDVQSVGMQLEFVSRETYKRRYDDDYLAELQQRYPDAMILPEGGSSQLAIRGCVQLANEINAIHQSDIMTVACGTGATFAGIICGLENRQTALGYSALKDTSLADRVEKFISNESCDNSHYQIINADFGGFAKLNREVLDFVFEWLDQTGILLDPIYTSKMCMRLLQQIEAGVFSPNTSITIIHSGGLQGWRGMKKRVVQLVGEKKWLLLHSYLEVNYNPAL